ncbi:MAG: trypsin-like peptidase domain-containing protein [Gemmatimonadaceae bacterium]
MSTRFSRTKLAGAILAGAAGGVILASSLDLTKYSWAQSKPSTGIPVARGGPMAPAEVGSFANVAERVTPSVVAINTIRDAKPIARGGRPRGGQQQVPPGMEEFMQQFGGRMPQQPQMQQEMRGEGSGFIVTQDGYIITNNHVVEDADHVKVTLSDQRQFDAKVIGRDSTTDVAVVKIDAKGLSTLPIGNDEAARIGDWVLAVGNPLGLDFTVTAGIISAKSRGGREVNLPNSSNISITDFIQTDAAINPGNSGGPLINLKGEAIGLNSAIASETGYYSGYGFAIPISLVKQVADALIKDGRVRLPMMGVSVGALSVEDAGANNLPQNGGVMVGDFTDSPVQPAKDAGIQTGDVIVAIAGQPVTRVSSLQRIVRSHAVGEVLTVDVVRLGARKQFKVKLAELDLGKSVASNSPSVEVMPPTAPAAKTTAKFGLSLEAVPADLAKALKLPPNTGVHVASVAMTSPVRDRFAGSDVITEVLSPGPRRAIKDAADLQSIIGSLKTGDYLSLNVTGLAYNGPNAPPLVQARIVNLRAN